MINADKKVRILQVRRQRIVWTKSAADWMIDGSLATTLKPSDTLQLQYSTHETIRLKQY